MHVSARDGIESAFKRRPARQVGMGDNSELMISKVDNHQCPSFSRIHRFMFLTAGSSQA